MTGTAIRTERRKRPGTAVGKRARRAAAAGQALQPSATRAPKPLSADALLKLMWLASPALPVGGFSYSEGLEAAVEAGLATTEDRTGAWLVDQLLLGLARADLPVACRAFDAWQRDDTEALAALNDWIVTTRESKETRLQTEQMGRSLVEWLKKESGADEDPRIAHLGALRPAPTWPVAYALAAVRTGAPRREALLAFAFGWAENMVQAALKSVPLGQSSGQRILARLTAAIPRAVDDAIALPTSARQAFTPMLAILSARHETQYSRLFRS
jgi:urease accessory protein